MGGSIEQKMNEMRWHVLESRLFGSLFLFCHPSTQMLVAFPILLLDWPNIPTLMRLQALPNSAQRPYFDFLLSFSIFCVSTTISLYLFLFVRVPSKM